jgi:single-strand DNA-binding protein
MNKVILIGRVCAKPEAFTTQSGVSRSSFRLAVNRPYKNPQGNYDADFLPIIAWRQTADFCNRYLDKGRQVAVEGSIQTRQYDAQDGSKRWVTEIIADRVEALGSKEDRSADAPAEPPQRNEQQRMDASGFTEVEDEKLPWEK